MTLLTIYQLPVPHTFISRTKAPVETVAWRPANWFLEPTAPSWQWCMEMNYAGTRDRSLITGKRRGGGDYYKIRNTGRDSRGENVLAAAVRPRGDVKIPKMWSPTCCWSWQQVVTEKSVTSDTLIVVSHHSWAVKSWWQLMTITHQFQGPSTPFSGEFGSLP